VTQPVRQLTNRLESKMGDPEANLPEIESLNLSDIDVSALDARLELTSIMPHTCTSNCALCTSDCVLIISNCPSLIST
jgi:hypothetical protein